MPSAVLIVDDDERIRISLSEVLARQELDVSAAASAESALGCIAEIGGLANPNLDPEMRPLQLTAMEKAHLEAYLRSLPGTG